MNRNRQKTVVPLKKEARDTRRWHLHKSADATLGVGDLKEAVKLPPKEDLNDWLAAHTVDFFNNINLFYSSIAEFCTAKSCPRMLAGPRVEYFSTFTTKTPVSMPAPDYVNHLLNWVADQVSDTAVFPDDVNSPYPKTFQVSVKNIFKRLLRVYAHMYYEHFGDIQRLGEEAHLNTSFKHFYYFVQHFKLIDKDQFQPLDSLIKTLFSGDGSSSSSSASAAANSNAGTKS